MLFPLQWLAEAQATGSRKQTITSKDTIERKERIRSMNKQSRGFFAEFREFAMRGNVIDLAVGVIIGSAFSAITTSLINDIIMPFIGLFVGGSSMTDMYVMLGTAKIAYGNFISSVLNFLIMAFVIFCMVKAINSLRNRTKKPEQETVSAPPQPSKEELLLTEIRDFIKEK